MCIRRSFDHFIQVIEQYRREDEVKSGYRKVLGSSGKKRERERAKKRERWTRDVAVEESRKKVDAAH